MTLASSVERWGSLFEAKAMQSALSEHFRRREFECQCGCGFDTIDVQTLEVLEAIRRTFGRVIITSGARCGPHNMAIGGSKKSQHLLGRAADFQVRDAEPHVVQHWLMENFRFLSIGRYDTFTHIDTRSNGPARWDRRTP